MTPAAIIDYITTHFAGVEYMKNGEDSFFVYNPRGDLKPNQQIPFITVISKDDYDTASNLSREGVFRVNVGVAKETYQKLFGDLPAFPKDGGIVSTGHDFSAIN